MNHNKEEILQSVINLVEKIIGEPLETPSSQPQKKWWDAFIERYPESLSYKNYSGADCIHVKKNNICTNLRVLMIKNNVCTNLRVLMMYVLQFENGGFWYTEDKCLYFVTNGYCSNENANYNDAKKFIDDYKNNWVKNIIS